MQAAQIAAVSDCLCYIEPAHDLIVSEESQNGHKKGQHTMTACLTGTGEIPFITPPPFSLKRSISLLYACLYQLCLVLAFSCLLEPDPGPQASTRHSEPRCHQGHRICLVSSLWVSLWYCCLPCYGLSIGVDTLSPINHPSCE